METVPTGLFRQLTLTITGTPSLPPQISTRVAPIPASTAVRAVGDHAPTPLAPELLARRQAYLKSFELLSVVYEALRRAATSREAPSVRLRIFIDGASPALQALHGLLQGALAGTPFSRNVRTKVAKGIHARERDHASLWDLGIRMDETLTLSGPVMPPMDASRLAGTLHEACHGPRALASILIELAGEAWGNVLSPDYPEVGAAWGTYARARWTEAELRNRSRLFSTLSRRLLTSRERLDRQERTLRLPLDP
ncbi:hypothetical protein D3C87_978880 [compost metagenome]